MKSFLFSEKTDFAIAYGLLIAVFIWAIIIVAAAVTGHVFGGQAAILVFTLGMIGILIWVGGDLP